MNNHDIERERKKNISFSCNTIRFSMFVPVFIFVWCVVVK